MLDVLLTLDVEDVYFDPSEGGDDHPIWLAGIMETCGLTGTFLFVGDKVRRLKKNGRQDVAQAMAPHSIGMHTNSNVHPTMPEYTAEVDWFEGLARVRDDERTFASEFEEFFERPPDVTSMHNCLGSTQQYVVAAEMNIPSLYGVPASVSTDTDISFCCGALNTSICGPSGLSMLGTGFDRSYSDDQRTDACITQIDDYVEKCLQAGRTYLNIFLGHPVMVRGVSPWFIYFLWPNGQNLSRSQADELGQAAIKPASVMPTVRRNFERVCRHIAEHPDLDVIHGGDLQRRYAWQKPSVTRDDLVSYIDRFVGTREDTPTAYVGGIPLDDWFTPAEIVAALTDGILAWSAEGKLPEQVERRNVLGPIEVPLVCPERARLSHKQMIGAATAVQDELVKTGYLPGNIPVDEKRIGLGSYLQGASEMYRQVTRSNESDAVELPRVSLRCPAFAHEIDTLWRRMIIEDGTIDPQINLESFCRHARLQSWTIKPAHRRL